MKHINTAQPGFHGANIKIKMKDNISNELYNLFIAITSEKDVPTQLTSTIKQLAEINKIYLRI